MPERKSSPVISRKKSARTTPKAAAPREAAIELSDPLQLARVLTPAKLAILDAVRAEEGSITSVAERLKRDRSTVKREVDELVASGVLTVEERVLPGHGRQKHIAAAAPVIHLSVKV